MKNRLMKIIAVFVGVFAMMAGPVAAQDYSGPAAEDGVFSAGGTVGAGSDVSFTATGLEPGAPVDAVLISADGDTTTLDASEVQGAVASRLATGTVGADGTVDLVITLPDDLESGTYVIEVRSTKADGSPFVSRVSFNAGGTLSGPNALALTGAETTNFVQIAALMILLGLGLVFVASRKRRAAASVTTD